MEGVVVVALVRRVQVLIPVFWGCDVADRSLIVLGDGFDRFDLPHQPGHHKRNQSERRQIGVHSDLIGRRGVGEFLLLLQYLDLLAIELVVDIASLIRVWIEFS